MLLNILMWWWWIMFSRTFVDIYRTNKHMNQKTFRAFPYLQWANGAMLYRSASYLLVQGNTSDPVKMQIRKIKVVRLMRKVGLINPQDYTSFVQGFRLFAIDVFAKNVAQLGSYRSWLAVTGCGLNNCTDFVFPVIRNLKQKRGNECVQPYCKSVIMVWHQSWN